MKRVLLLSAFTLLSLASMAQDLIVKKDGSVIQAKVDKIGTAEVEYKKWSNQDGPTYAIAKSDILAITYQNGEKEMFSADENSNTQDLQSPQLISKQPDARNQELLNTYNKDYHLLPSPIQNTNKDTKYGIAFLCFTPESILSNDEIEVQFVLDRSQHPDECLFGMNPSKERSAFFRYRIIIINKTDKNIYVDMANCFRTSNIGESYCYYNQDVITEGSTHSSGVAFNIGGITGALGVGGAIGSVAGATTIGRTNSTSLSTTHIQQRILTIPPRGRSMLAHFEYATRIKGSATKIGEYEFLHEGEEFFFVPGLSYESLGNTNRYFSDLDTKTFTCKELRLQSKDLGIKYGAVKIGNEINYNLNNTPFELHYNITYSKNEDFSTYSILSPTLYLKKIIGMNAFKLRDWFKESYLQQSIENHSEYTIIGPVLMPKK